LTRGADPCGAVPPPAPILVVRPQTCAEPGDPCADTLGSAFGIAAADITEKCEVLNKRLGELRARAEKEGGVAPALKTGAQPDVADKRVRLTLQFLVQSEMDKKVERSNSWSYVSGARSLLRLMWFLDFIHALIGNLINEPAMELGECARKVRPAALSRSLRERGAGRELRPCRSGDRHEHRRRG
jgi:hypothetical protein